MLQPEKPYMKAFLIILISSALMLGCGNNKATEEFEVNIDVKNELAHLQDVTIFFGHQSVGSNILDGVDDLLERSGLSGSFPITALEQDQNQSESFIIHSPIGKNQDPISKCDDFYQKMHEGLGERVDMALFKFCYIDIHEHTDIEAIFKYYQSVMTKLKKEFPSVKFIHATVPLRTSPDNLGVKLREFMGRENRSKLANIKRNEFNALLTEHFNQDSIFDIARWQSSHYDGRIDFFRIKGRKYYRLIEEYTDDGGHLNARGREWVAAHFIRVLAEAAQ